MAEPPVITKFSGYSTRTPEEIRRYIEEAIVEYGLNEFFADEKVPQVVGLLPVANPIQNFDDIKGYFPLISVWQNSKNQEQKRETIGYNRKKNFVCDKAFLDTIRNKQIGVREGWVVISDAQVDRIQAELDAIGGTDPQLRGRFDYHYRMESVKLQVWDHEDEDSVNLIGDTVLSILEDMEEEAGARLQQMVVNAEYGATNFNYGAALVGVDITITFVKMYWRARIYSKQPAQIDPGFMEVFGSAQKDQPFGDSTFTAPGETVLTPDDPNDLTDPNHPTNQPG